MAWHAHAELSKVPRGDGLHDAGPAPTDAQPNPGAAAGQRGLHLKMRLENPVVEKLYDYAEANLQTRPLMVALPDAFRGRTVALCGAGPSLRTATFDDVDMVFACNSALPYLVDKGVPVAAGCAIDQMRAMVDEWQTAPPVLYYLASTVDPELVRHLRAHDRQVVFFHNMTGMLDTLEAEFDYYCRAWAPTLAIGTGQTVVGRMISLCEWLGFERIDVHGADCAFDGADDVAHANGDTAVDAYGSPGVFTGRVGGRDWRTRFDMLHEAVLLARRARTSAGRIRLVGDTLPNALIDAPDEYLDLVCRWLGPDEEVTDPMLDPASRALIEQWS